MTYIIYKTQYEISEEKERPKFSFDRTIEIFFA